MLKCGEKKIQFIVIVVFVLYISKMRKKTINTKDGMSSNKIKI